MTDERHTIGVEIRGDTAWICERWDGGYATHHGVYVVADVEIALNHALAYATARRARFIPTRWG